MKFATKLLILNFILTFAFLQSTQAQTVIRGEVKDKGLGEALIGASVVVRGTTDGTVTDFDGVFEIRTREELPVTLIISYVGYAALEVAVSGTDEYIKARLEEESITTDVVEVRGQRISEKQRSSPLTVESLDVLAIKETAANNFYDGLGSLKGVDLTAASLGFKVINTRGFNSTSPVRSLQIIDGVDNQAPGLNFSLGNFLGASELDVLKVDLIQGASSSFYGPNAFNGVISMETKDPFLQKGLSASIKAGERNLREGALRWADAFKNKEGFESFGYKFNFFYLEADDWVADNYAPIDGSDVPASNPGRYDAVNIYGDEYFPLADASTVPLWVDPGLGIWYRTGYREEDLVDYDTRNIKANLALHFRTNPAAGHESPEFILSSNFGTGTTVYQGDNRFSLKNILFFQNRLEFRKRDNYFIRLYATHDNAGDSYDPYVTALLLQDAVKNDEDWAQDYRRYWKQNITRNNNRRLVDLGYPELVFNPQTGMFEFDNQAAEAWLVEYRDSLAAWHGLAEAFANQANPNIEGTLDFLQPGTENFQREFERITSTPNSSERLGSRFVDRSALYHVHGEKVFHPSFADHIRVGGNARLYTPVSDGTIFYDTAGVKITNYEFGFYGGIEKNLAGDKLKLNLTARVDKNENFDWISTPAASIVYKPRANNYLRVSFSSGIRNPTLTDQYLFLNVGRATLAGNLNGVDSLVTLESFDVFRGTLKKSDLAYFNIDPVRPEKVKTFELGYRTTLFNRLYIDAGYYYNIYNDFLGFNIGLDIEFDPSSSFPLDITAFRYAANSREQVTTQGFSLGANFYFGDFYQFFGNYSWNRLNSQTDDPIIPAFNTPEHKFNLGFSGRDIPVKLGGSTQRLGFRANYKWIESFNFEGSPQFTGLIPGYSLLDAQINLNVDRWNTILKIGASNLLDNRNFQAYGGPRIGRMAYASILYEWNKR